MYILKTSCLNFFLFFGLLPNLTLVLYRKPPSLLKTCLTGSSCVWQYLSTLVCPMICMRTQAGKHVGFLSSLLGGCCLQCSGILIKGNSCIHNLPLFKKLYSLCMHLQGDITGFKTNLFFSFHVQTITYETCCFYTHLFEKFMLHVFCIKRTLQTSFARDPFFASSVDVMIHPSRCVTEQHEWKRWATPDLAVNPPQEASCRAWL